MKTIFTVILISFGMNGFSQEPYFFIPKNTINVLFQAAIESKLDGVRGVFINTTGYCNDGNQTESELITIITNSEVAFTSTNSEFISGTCYLTNKEITVLVQKNWLKTNIAIVRSIIHKANDEMQFSIKELYFSQFPDSNALRSLIPPNCLIKRVPMNDLRIEYKDYKSPTFTAVSSFFNKRGLYIDPNVTAFRSSYNFYDSIEIKGNAAGGFTMCAFLPHRWLAQQFNSLYKVTDSSHGVDLILKNNTLVFNSKISVISSDIEGILNGRRLRNKYRLTASIESNDFVVSGFSVIPLTNVSPSETNTIQLMVSQANGDLKGKFATLFNKQHAFRIYHSPTLFVEKWLEMKFCSVTQDYVIVVNQAYDVQKMH